MDNMNFKATEQDVLWMKNLMSIIEDGGSWVTSFAMFKKQDDTTLICIQNSYPDKVYVERNIERVKIVCKDAGITFIDKREKK